MSLLQHPSQRIKLGKKSKLLDDNVSQKEKFSTAQRLIAQTFKRQRIMFKKFGPIMFCRKGGQSADYGNIHFMGRTKPSKFIIVSDSTTPALLSNLFQKYWDVPKPDVLISVTGGAQDFELEPRLQRAFNFGLVAAASASNAWLVTSGTHTGVMKLVADAVSHTNLPLVGVAPFGAIKGREALAQGPDRNVFYSRGLKARARPSRVSAMRHHSVALAPGGPERRAAEPAAHALRAGRQRQGELGGVGRRDPAARGVRARVHGRQARADGAAGGAGRAGHAADHGGGGAAGDGAAGARRLGRRRHRMLRLL